LSRSVEQVVAAHARAETLGPYADQRDRRDLARVLTVRLMIVTGKGSTSQHDRQGEHRQRDRKLDQART
jgi:hypothetical protein